MANSAAHVVVGKPAVTGGAFTAPLGTALPDDLATVLAAAFKGVGYVSTDGVVQSIGADSNDIVAWGGDTVRKVQTSHDVTYALTMIETNAATQGVFYGTDRVVVTAATVSTGELLAIKITAIELPHAVWDFEILDGTRTGRIVLPDAQVTERGDVSFINDDSVSYPITLSAFPDKDGVKAYIYWNDGTFTGV